MRILTTSIVSALLAASLCSQSETSPKGFLATEGSSSHVSNFGYYTAAYGYGSSYLHIDATNLGQARNLAKLSVRRDGMLATNTKYVARTIQVTLRMAHADWSRVKANDPQVDSEYLLTPWSTVMNAKTVNLPNYATKPVSAPAPFDAVFVLDTKFAYDGARALAFQMLSSPSSDLQTNLSGYPVDHHSVPSSVGPQTEYGTGCTTNGNTQPMRHNSYLVNHGPMGKVAWSLDTSLAPTDAPMAILIGGSNPNLAVGACELVFVQPLVTLSATTSSEGSSSASFAVPHQPGFLGAQIYSQSVALDTSKPLGVALSGGMRVVFPADPVQPAFANANQLVHWFSPTWPTDNVIRRGAGIVFGLHE